MVIKESSVQLWRKRGDQRDIWNMQKSKLVWVHFEPPNVLAVYTMFKIVEFKLSLTLLQAVEIWQIQAVNLNFVQNEK